MSIVRMRITGRNCVLQNCLAVEEKREDKQEDSLPVGHSEGHLAEAKVRGVHLEWCSRGQVIKIQVDQLMVLINQVDLGL